MDAADVVALGLATHCVASSSIDDICDALAALDGGQPPAAFADAVDATLQSFRIEPPGASAARAHADAIDACFSEPDVPSIPVWKSTSELGYPEKYRGDLREPHAIDNSH